MAQITYHNLNGDAPRVTWHGLALEDGKSVEVPDNHAILDAVEQKQNPMFEVSGRGDPAAANKRGPGRPPKSAAAPAKSSDPDAARKAGTQAAHENKPRVPPADLSPSDQAAWTAAYNDAKGA